MKKLLWLFAFLVFGTAPVMAQGSSRFELSAGGSFRLFQQTETSDESKIGMPGWYASGVYNIHHFRDHFGVQLEGTGGYRSQGTFGDTSIYTLLIGPRVYPFGHHKLTPYGQFLFGEGYYRNEIPAYGGYQSSVYSSYGKAWEVGGGLDLRIKKHWGVRMMQFDFGQTRFFSSSIYQTNYRASIGIIYRFGGR